MRRSVIVCGVPILATLLVVASYSFTQEPAKKPGSTTGPSTTVAEAPKPVDDPPFDQLVDVETLATAIEKLDASGITDAGAMLARAEEILQRKHRSGVTADGVFILAAFVAAEKQDKETLARLSKIAERDGRKELAGHIKTISLLPSKTRAPAKTVSIDMPLGEIVRQQGELQQQMRASIDRVLPPEAQKAAKTLEEAAGTTRGHYYKKPPVGHRPPVGHHPQPYPPPYDPCRHKGHYPCPVPPRSLLVRVQNISNDTLNYIDETGTKYFFGPGEFWDYDLAVGGIIYVERVP